MNAPVHKPELEDRGVLRFITAGSVDDGKSTLIGRLLYEAKGIFADQLAAVTRATRKRTGGDALDLSLLTDGLEAEREQGITIDVAYRYFASPVRKFIIADAPGHEQYTRNMVTGASTADAAIILVDVTRVGNGELLPQTKRHSAIAKLLGIRHVIVAVNKIDLAGFDEAVFEHVRAEYDRIATRLGLTDVHYIPISALEGDNVVRPSERTPWYSGPPLLELLESLPADRDDAALPLRYPVQLVIRANGSSADDFRGYAGQVRSGKLRRGQRVRVVPGGESAIVESIELLGRAIHEAVAGRSVTVRLDRDLDVSRGDVLIDAEDHPRLARHFEADVCWLDRTPLDPRRKYLLRHGAKTVQARIDAIGGKLDVQSLTSAVDAETLAMNDIGRVSLTIQQPIVCDVYQLLPATGAFILIDPVTNQTAAAGMIRESAVVHSA
jgi:sulfate adenylyltransferase subunit 1